jgi:hypothetical protein
MLTRAVVLVLALVAASSVVYTTPWGVGTGFDQGTYIGAARNLLAGRGLSIPWGEASGQPMTQFPPLYPLVLAGVGAFGADPWQAARYLDVVLRAVDLLLAAGVAWRIKATPAAPLLAAFLLCCSVHMEFVFGSAWSEPLFLALMLISLALLAEFVVVRSTKLLVACALAAAAALLTRYVGLALVLSGTVVLLWRLDTPMLSRMRFAAIFGGIGLAPLVVWLLRNAAEAPTIAGNRAPGAHAVPIAHFTTGLFTLLDWVMPSNIAVRLVTPEGLVSPVGGAVLGVAALGIAVLLWKARPTLQPKVTLSQELTLTLATFSSVYVVCVLLSILMFDDLTQLDSRILSPVYVCLVILASAYGGEALTSAWLNRRRLRPVMAGVCAVFVGAYALRFGALAERAHVEGVIYSNLAWLRSPTMQAVQLLPRDARVFSNAPDAIYMLANRNAYEIPFSSNSDAFLLDLSDRLHQTSTPIVLVYFDDPNIAYRQPVPPQVVSNSLALQNVNHYSDGAMYEVTP